MGKPHPVELRECAGAPVEQGNTHTETARRLCVSIKSVNDMVRLKRETGALEFQKDGGVDFFPSETIASGNWCRLRT